MTDEKRKIIDALVEAVRQAVAFSNEDMTQTQRLGTENSFVEVPEIMVSFQGLMHKVNVCHFDDVPEPVIVELDRQVRGVLRSVDQLRKYQAAQGPGDKTNLLTQLRNQTKDILPAAVPILALNAMQPFEDYSKKMANFANQAEAILAGIRDKVQEATAATESAKAAAQSAKEAATKTGVSEQTHHFQLEADKYLWWSRFWLWLVILGIGAIVAIGLWTFFHPYDVTPATRWMIVQKSIAKLVLLSIASFFLVFAVRNYNTSRHNQVVNVHRAKALATFQAFAADAKDDETKKAVLMYAARAAFGHQSSGYLKKEGDYAGPSVIDLAKLFSGK